MLIEVFHLLLYVSRNSSIILLQRNVDYAMLPEMYIKTLRESFL